MSERLPDDELQRLLREDAPYGDLTTRSLFGIDGVGEAQGLAAFAARGAMRVACIEEAARILELCGCKALVETPSGHDAQAGQILLRAQGLASDLLLGWKVAQTLTEAASGIATEAARIVGLLRAAGFAAPLTCTRKAPPGARAMAVRAVVAGGAVMRRLGLSETLLVFPEHRVFFTSEELAQKLKALRAAQPEKRLVVEVGNAEDAMALAQAGAEVLQLERFSPKALAELKASLLSQGLEPLIAPAGGVTAANALDYARAGADFLVSSAPYFAPPADVQVSIGPVRP